MDNLPEKNEAIVLARGIYAAGWAGAWAFLTRQVFTRDEADPQAPIKPFPDKEYLRLLTQRWVEEKLLAVPKSRRMLVSWALTALHLWDALLHEYRAIYIGARKLEGSEELVGRCKFIHEHLRMPGLFPVVKTRAARASKHPEAVNALHVPETGSSIQAVAEGADQMRQYAASRYLGDEFAFWGKARATWTALKPAVEGGGQICIVSSPSPGFMEAIVHDQL
ncbi:MAG: hypothetical protein UY48_C0002G0024 [Candidatus Gottesmanbacteria bacterium GW2011_GWB1_49_7]|uniref:Uncharacterized protein n=1 Tax=Candidatus Gottesmanbacteria bacterium GW2011_GWB1_49_7 TaxID=1618448 RepID=A0A0G1W3Q3_9BACT|nr:MAG: hypothetical protein UY48_C0002G0024 [Candidatus Gottesmanbacteria bacterium GW2011_GWB1_49_7]